MMEVTPLGTEHVLGHELKEYIEKRREALRLGFKIDELLFLEDDVNGLRLIHDSFISLNRFKSYNLVGKVYGIPLYSK